MHAPSASSQCHGAFAEGAMLRPSLHPQPLEAVASAGYIFVDMPPQQKVEEQEELLVDEH
jgi:hypothetical protein